MSDQTGTAVSSETQTATTARITPSERATLRRFATEVAELAGRPVEEQKKDLWYRHN